MRGHVLFCPFLGAELLLEEVGVEYDGSTEQVGEVRGLASLLSRQIFGKKLLVLLEHQGDKRAGRTHQTALFLNKLVCVCTTVHVMVNDSSHLASKVTLLSIQHVMVYQCHLVNDLHRVWILRSELIIKVQIVLTYLAILQMFRYFQITVKVCLVAVDDGDPLLVEFALIIVGQHDGTNGRVNVTTCVAHYNSQFVSASSLRSKRTGSNCLIRGFKPLSESLHRLI